MTAEDDVQTIRAMLVEVQVSLGELRAVADRTEAQATRTNGRVTILEMDRVARDAIVAERNAVANETSASIAVAEHAHEVRQGQHSAWLDRSIGALTVIASVVLSHFLL